MMAGAQVPVSGEGQTVRGQSVVVRYINLVKLPHTVFALPFALLGVVYGSFYASLTIPLVLLVVLAFTAARFAAMAFNRIVDRKFDALNPRTRNREIPRGLVSVTHAKISVVAAGGVFVAAAGLLNPLCLILSPVAFLWILSYSFTKRFTNWSHLWLGGSLAIAPVGGYLAVTGAWSDPWWTLPVLALAVMTWVAGFDMFYALQDEDFDRTHGLKSAVVLLGRKWSIFVGKLLHGLTIGSLLLFAWGTSFGWPFLAGIGVAAAILTWEHQLVRPNDWSRLNAAFFNMNGVMSTVVFLGALGGRLL